VSQHTTPDARAAARRQGSVGVPDADTVASPMRFILRRGSSCPHGGSSTLTCALQPGGHSVVMQLVLRRCVGVDLDDYHAARGAFGLGPRNCRTSYCSNSAAAARVVRPDRVPLAFGKRAGGGWSIRCCSPTAGQPANRQTSSAHRAACHSCTTSPTSLAIRPRLASINHSAFSSG